MAMQATMTLKTARDVVRNLALHIGGSTFSDEKVDMAIRIAGEKFLRETLADRTTVNVATAADDTTLDVTATAADFMPGTLLVPPFIGSTDQKLSVVTFENIRQLRNQGGTSGRPEAIAWLTPGEAHIFPTADAIYTITFAYYKPLVSYTNGDATPGDVTINIPDRYVYEVMANGAAGQLLQGAPGHPDWRAKLDAFEQLIYEARGELNTDGVWFLNQSADYDTSYFRSGYV